MQEKLEKKCCYPLQILESRYKACVHFSRNTDKKMSREVGSKMKVLYRETLLLFQLWSPLGFWFPFAKFSMQKHRGGKQESLYASASHPCAMPVSSFALLKWCLMMITLLENVKRSKDNQKEIQDEKDVFKRIKKESKDHSKTFLRHLQEKRIQ